ncbi:MAG: LysR family transcriptional regulator [Dehalococcoidia bacterium]|nr:LysR family transcriptional regulator [Dehalococcoidia bacterium]
MDNTRKISKSLSKPSRFGRHLQPGYVVKADVWIEKDGELYIGGGRAILLENIGLCGSIAAAARSMGLAYSNAWLWVEAMNRLAPSPLVKKSIGGLGGSGTQLTDEGHRAIAAYRELRIKLAEIIAQP